MTNILSFSIIEVELEKFITEVYDFRHLLKSPNTIWGYVNDGVQEDYLM